MRHGRSKAARRTLQFFRRTIDLSPPYHVILDGTFLVAVLRYKLQDEIRDRIAKLLQLDPSQSQQLQPHNNSQRAGQSQQNQQQLYCHVPRSSLQELENLLSSLQEKSKPAKGEAKEQLELLERARQWGLDESDEVLETMVTQSEETKEPQPPTPKAAKGGGNRKNSQETAEASLSTAAQDILRFVAEQQGTGSPNHGGDQGSARGGKSSKTTTARRSRIYLVASQDEQLLHHLRRVGRVPCLHLARGGVLLLESPSHMAVDIAQREESAKWNAKEESLGFADESSNNDGEGAFHQLSQQQQQQQTRVLKRKARGPNPLSCKKKKVETPKQQQRPSTTKPAATTSNDGASSAKSSRRRRRKTSGNGEPKSESASAVES